MVSVRRGGRALVVAFLAAGGLLAVASPVRAGNVFVEVSPTTAQPGQVVGIRASCPDNSVPATVESAAFGLVTVQPQHGVLTAAAMVGERTRPDSYRVKLTCRDGTTATTTLGVLAGGHPPRGPATGFGGLAGGGPDPADYLVTAGAASTVAGVVLGLFAVRRRRTGSSAVRAGARVAPESRP